MSINCPYRQQESLDFPFPSSLGIKTNNSIPVYLPCCHFITFSISAHLFHVLFQAHFFFSKSSIHYPPLSSFFLIGLISHYFFPSIFCTFQLFISIITINILKYSKMNWNNQIILSDFFFPSYVCFHQSGLWVYVEKYCVRKKNALTHLFQKMWCSLSWNWTMNHRIPERISWEKTFRVKKYNS